MPTRWPGFDSRMTHFWFVPLYRSGATEARHRRGVPCIQHLTVAQLVERGTVNYTAVIPRSMVRIRPVRLSLAEWPSGLRRWFKAPVSSEARVRISLQSLFGFGACAGPAGPRGTANWIVYERERSGAAEARWAHNPKVGGSKPPFATFCRPSHVMCSYSLVVRTPRCGRGNPGSNPGRGITYARVV